MQQSSTLLHSLSLFTLDVADMHTPLSVGLFTAGAAEGTTPSLSADLHTAPYRSCYVIFPYTRHSVGSSLTKQVQGEILLTN
jgi:hypothetical protein